MTLEYDAAALRGTIEEERRVILGRTEGPLEKLLNDIVETLSNK